MNSRLMVRRYDRAAQGWTLRIGALGYDAAYREFAELAVGQLPRPRSICDIGCGTGAFSAAVLGQVKGPLPALTLVDPSGQMLARASGGMARHGISAQTRHTNLANTQGQWDWVLAAHVIEHCADPAAAFADLIALTHPGGAVLLVISRPHWCQWLIWPLWRHRWFTPAQVLHWAMAAGLTHVLTHSFSAGSPSRTSLGYLFTHPKPPKDSSC